MARRRVSLKSLAVVHPLGRQEPIFKAFRVRRIRAFGRGRNSYPSTIVPAFAVDRLRHLEEEIAKRADRVGERILLAPSTNRVFQMLYENRLTHYVYDRLQRARTRQLLERTKEGPVPKHVGIIMDGNRRFAQRLGMDPNAGHVLGRKKLEDVMKWCLELGIKYLTVYAFSTENFKRAPEEVELLMRLFELNYREMADHPDVHQHKIRVRTLGRIDLLPPSVQEAARYADERTKGYDQYFFNVAVAYGGREELLTAFRNIAREIKTNGMMPEDIDEALIARHLYTSGLPDPDLILRTSGEERISNFLLWQAAYSELYFADVYWPALRKKDFLKAIESYQLRKRRFGK
jgi:tritrans,polycis-undecaprenyl-diphosphate synthase [geranylgeranyl-diphosphate specific]